LRTPFFYGEHELTIDPKNRLLVPAEIRKVIVPEIDGDAFFVTLRNNKVPWFYPERYYRELINSVIPPGIAPDAELIKWMRSRISLAVRVEWDSQGRVVVPDSLIQRAGLQKKVCLIGICDHLELWNQTDWDAQREELYSQDDAIEEIAKKRFATQAKEKATTPSAPQVNA